MIPLLLSMLSSGGDAFELGLAQRPGGAHRRPFLGRLKSAPIDIRVSQ